MNGGYTAIINVSLAFDPSAWTTEIEIAPNVTDTLFPAQYGNLDPHTRCIAHLRDGDIFSPVCKN